MTRSWKVLLIILAVTIVGVVLVTRFAQKDNAATSSESSDMSQNKTSGSPSQDTLALSFMDNLRQREFEGGEIKIEETRVSNGVYTSYLISYPSDNLTIYGLMNIPTGTGPFPVIVLNHGYYNTSSFSSGDGTQTMADILARQGYLTLASDYRGHGKSESDGTRAGHRPEYSIDVLNLLASIKSVDKADINRVGMWGHSMGGEVSLRAIEATDLVKAVALWAPTSANASDNHAFYGAGRNQNSNESNLDGISPVNYLEFITAPISIHQGLADTEVKPEWSKSLYDNLRSKNKQAEYFEYSGQDHNFRNLGWTEISTKTIAFYDKLLK